MRPLICRGNQWTGFLYHRDLRHERVKLRHQVDLISKNLILKTFHTEAATGDVLEKKCS